MTPESILLHEKLDRVEINLDHQAALERAIDSFKLSNSARCYLDFHHRVAVLNCGAKRLQSEYLSLAASRSALVEENAALKRANEALLAAIQAASADLATQAAA